MCASVAAAADDEQRSLEKRHQTAAGRGGASSQWSAHSHPPSPHCMDRTAWIGPSQRMTPPLRHWRAAAMSLGQASLLVTAAEPSRCVSLCAPLAGRIVAVPVSSPSLCHESCRARVLHLPSSLLARTRSVQSWHCGAQRRRPNGKPSRRQHSRTRTAKLGPVSSEGTERRLEAQFQHNGQLRS